MNQDRLNIVLKDRTLIITLWIIDMDREQIDALVLGEGSICKTMYIDRREIVSPAYLAYNE